MARAPRQPNDIDRQHGIVISLRLEAELAEKFRTEARRHGKKLNTLFAEMWSLYAEKRDVTA